MMLVETLKLTPFVLAQVNYWRSDLETRLHNPWTKCLPIASLILYLLTHAAATSGKKPLLRRIKTGLFFCMLGDAFLTVDDDNYFLAGMVAFGIGHVCYVAAFGGHGGLGFKFGLNLMVLPIWPIYLSQLLPCIMASKPDLTLPTFFYAVVMSALVWTSGSRLAGAAPKSSGGGRHLTRLSGAVGTIIFAA